MSEEGTFAGRVRRADFIVVERWDVRGQRREHRCGAHHIGVEGRNWVDDNVHWMNKVDDEKLFSIITKTSELLK